MRCDDRVFGDGVDHQEETGDIGGLRRRRWLFHVPPPKAKVGLQTGNLVPDFELKTVDGKAIKLSSLGGKKVILNYWATWCPPCKLEVPEIESGLI